MAPAHPHATWVAVYPALLLIPFDVVLISRLITPSCGEKENSPVNDDDNSSLISSHLSG